MTDRRGSRFAFEVLFLVALAVGLTLGEVRTAVIVGVMALGWVIVAALEWAAWRDQPHFGSGLPPRYYVPRVNLPPAQPLEQFNVGYPDAHRDEAPTWIASASLRAEVLGDWPAAVAGGAARTGTGTGRRPEVARPIPVRLPDLPAEAKPDRSLPPVRVKAGPARVRSPATPSIRSPSRRRSADLPGGATRNRDRRGAGAAVGPRRLPGQVDGAMRPNVALRELALAAIALLADRRRAGRHGTNAQPRPTRSRNRKAPTVPSRARAARRSSAATRHVAAFCAPTPSASLIRRSPVAPVSSSRTTGRPCSLRSSTGDRTKSDGSST